MPPKHSVKEYESGGFYHIFNRGVEKRIIFADEQDYHVFISYLKMYLCSEIIPESELTKRAPTRQLNHYAEEIKLLAFCLMPNHYHLLIRQNSERGMANFMQSITTKYVMYFNAKYKRVGSLFQGRYKTVKMESEAQALYVSKYIHRNPLNSQNEISQLINYRYSSYLNYLGMITQGWVDTEEILSYYNFPKREQKYQRFVERSGDLKIVYNAMMDLDV